jgi:malate dehydrogenase (oxaloacetate-decarboxylating)
LEPTVTDHDRLDYRARDLRERALRWHRACAGKIQVIPKCPVSALDDFSVWYSPGVAETCMAIHADASAAFDYTNVGNSVAIVSNGTRVLGLGNIGPRAAMPVMEGKALLFKYLGGVDAIPLCLNALNPDELVHAVRALEPTFGAINLEDIEQPDCFNILDALESGLSVPVWHDDQQGTATVALAGLMNALRVAGNRLETVKIALIGCGAANVALYRLLLARGADPGAIVACDSVGILHPGRSDIEIVQARFRDKWRICRETNGDRATGGIAEAMRGADVCIAFSSPGPGTIRPEWIRRMRPGAIVFACANPTPEIWPQEAKEAGARIVATGRGDFPNQVNNALCFPGVFRGVLEVRARAITQEMALAAAEELERLAQERGLHADAILPAMTDPDVAVREAVAVAMKAQRQGVAALARTAAEIEQLARARIGAAQASLHVLMREGLIPDPRGNCGVKV